MAETVSFKSRVRSILIQNAPLYFSHFVCNDYLIISEAFHKCPYYIISAEKDNFLHLTGVSTKLSATAFFDKCLDGSLTEMDFEIGAPGSDAKSAKGSVRRKIKVLPLIGDLFLHNCEVEEDFTKNTVFCSFASSDGSCTLGFIAIPKARPKTLLSGNELDRGKSDPLQIVLSKERTKQKFSTVCIGTDEQIASHYAEISHLLDDELLHRIEDLLQRDNTAQGQAD